MKPPDQAASSSKRIARDCLPRRLGCALLVMLGLGLSYPLGAASPGSTQADAGQPAKIRQLFELISDPAVQSWIRQQEEAKATPPASPMPGQTPAEYLSSRMSVI